MRRTGVALVGCGYVADFYVRTLAAHPHLELLGVTDRDPEHSARLSRHHGVRAYGSLGDLLDDPRATIVVNLTNPESHFEVSRAALEAGRHVYSEKPLATDIGEARELVDLARRRERLIVSAPCSILGETAQTLWKALRERRVGRVRLVYAELDDGMVHRGAYRRWISESGAPWPYRDEFRVGCTLEHAGYYVTWLTAFFGPVESVVAFASCLVPDKTAELAPEEVAPDFSVATVSFASGVVARLTCSIVAPHDHSLRIVGDEGVLGTRDCWYYDSPVHVRRHWTIRRRRLLSPIKSRVRLVRRPLRLLTRASGQMDFARGVAEVAEALVERRPCRLSMEYCLHNTEVVLAIHNAATTTMPYRPITSFAPMEPMPWAR
jgi:predicted dehydrogenase